MKTSNKAGAKGSSDKANGDQVSELTTNRLSVYLRCLNALEEAGVRAISSQALAEQFHLNAAQIRKDLAYFGEFGVRGVGYYVRDLKRHLRQILGLDRNLRVAIIGAGNLGLALADYPGFRQEGFEIVALFDTLSAKVGQQSRGRRADSRGDGPQEDRAPRRHQHRRDCRAGARRRSWWSIRSSPPASRRSSTFRPARSKCPPA